MDVLIELRSPDEVLELFGSQDQNLKAFRERFPDVSFVARSGVIKLSGGDDRVEMADRALRKLLRRVRRREALTPEALQAVLADEDGPPAPAAPEDGARRGNGSAAPVTAAVPLRIASFRPRTDGQRRYIEVLEQNEIVFAIGPAGTGKTFLAVYKAVEMLRSGEVGRIILCRPAVEAGERLGFLPGDFHAKVNPYLRPLYDALNELLDPDTVRKLIEREIIEILPLAYMRGRTLNRSFIILDEAQNTTAAQMKMFLTRMGEGSRIVVTGDETQVDLPPGKISGLAHVQRILRPTRGIAFQHMQPADIVRHPLVWKIVRAYEREGAGAEALADDLPGRAGASGAVAR